MDQEIAKLWLNTGSLTTSQSQTGVRSANFMSVTFNFDLRLVLGETLWSKYKYFKMYFTDTHINTPSVGLGMTTLFQNGLNLIQASYQGKPPGFQTAIDETNLSSVIALPNQLNRSANTHNFVMIKPDNNNVQLTLEFVDEAGTTATLVPRIFFLAFVPIDDTKIYRNPYTMLYQNEQVNFTLSMKILTTGGTNEYGTMNANRTIATFTNINMRHILGTLWDKYKKFNLIFNTIGVSANATPSSGSTRRMWWSVEGLQFINTLRVTTGYTQGIAFSPQTFYQTNQSDTEYCEAPMSVTTFRRPESENVDLTFATWNSVNGGIPSNVSNGFCTFTISVVGVKE
jgi:hypothetical protein